MRIEGPLIGASLLLLAHPSHAQGTESQGDALVSAIAACRALAIEQRLACYEQSSAALIAAREQGTVRIVDRAVLQRTKRTLFGFSLPHLDLFGTQKGDPRAVSDTDVTTVTDTITKVQPAAYGLWVFSLAGGGVWQSITQSLTFEPKAGDTIIIKAGMLGHYSAKVGNDRAVDVKRLR